jgi:excinuclease ABC subunit A
MSLTLGEGAVIISQTVQNSESADAPSRDILFSSKFACGTCGRSFQPPSPQLFSFNSPQGMCPSCDGLGQLYTFVPELLIEDESLSFKAGAISLLGKWADMGRYRRHIYQNVAAAVEAQLSFESGSMLSSPWRDLPAEARKVWLWGIDETLSFTWRGGKSAKKYEGDFNGIIPELLDRYRNSKNKMQLRQFEKQMHTINCIDCNGQRLNPQATAVRLQTNVRTFFTSAL